MCCFNTTRDKSLLALVCVSDGYNNQDTFCHFEIMQLVKPHLKQNLACHFQNLPTGLSKKSLKNSSNTSNRYCIKTSVLFNN